MWNHTKKDICVSLCYVDCCSSKSFTAYKTLQKLSKRQKLNPQTSHMCLKWKISVGTFTHCVWLCPKIQAYWIDILQDRKKIFGMVLGMNPLSLLLGYPSQQAFVDTCSSRLYDILTYTARKNICKLYCVFILFVF